MKRKQQTSSVEKIAKQDPDTNARGSQCDRAPEASDGSSNAKELAASRSKWNLPLAASIRKDFSDKSVMRAPSRNVAQVPGTLTTEPITAANALHWFNRTKHSGKEMAFIMIAENLGMDTALWVAAELGWSFPDLFQQLGLDANRKALP